MGDEEDVMRNSIEIMPERGKSKGPFTESLGCRLREKRQCRMEGSR